VKEVLVRLALLLVGSMVAGCSQPQYDLKHVFEQQPGAAFETGQVGDTTRPFVAFAAGESSVDLGPARRGFLRAYLALDGEQSAGDATATLELSGVGFAARLIGGEPASCRVVWEAAPERTAWRECLLPIPRDLPNARLQIRFEGRDDTRLRVASAILVATDARQRPNVFVIVLDTARVDVFKTFNAEIPTGEHLDVLARDGVVFEDLRAPSSWTRASVATLITGLSQTRHHVFNRLNPLPPGLTTLQSHLHDHGYYAMAWSTNPNILPIWGFAAGFDLFVDAGVVDWQSDKADASAVLERTRTTLAANRQLPGLYYLHFMDPHHPYAPGKADLREMEALTQRRPELYPTPLLATPPARVVRGEYRRYLGEIRDLDRKLGAFLGHLKEIGVYDDSLILVVSDHGEQFLDHGDRYHGIDLYEEALHVPGILKLPGNERAGTRIARSVGLADFLPTVSSALGLVPPADIEGVDVFAEDAPNLPQVAQLVLDEHRKVAIKHGGWKLIVDYISGETQLYHVEEDPKELRNRIDDEPERALELRELLDRMAALHEVGWHIRGCGCVKSDTLRFVVGAENAEIAGIGLEANDAPRTSGDEGAPAETEVVFELKPTASRQERFGRKIKRLLSDEDELVLRAAEAASPGFDLTIRPTDAAGLRFARGNRDPLPLNGPFVFQPDDPATHVDIGEPVNCRPPQPAAAKRTTQATSACEPYVRIWYVAPPRAISESTVDPNISERLKALGYTW
jgi:arylsulfatase A-like enzyme